VGSKDERYTFARYELGRDPETKKDTLTIWQPEGDVAKMAVRRGAVKGTIPAKDKFVLHQVMLEDSTENLAKYFNSDLGKEMFSSGRKDVLVRIR
jgi:hypothetical protein